MCPPPAATAGTFPPRGCALFAKPELPLSQLSGPRARERRGGVRRGSAGRPERPRGPSSAHPRTGRASGAFSFAVPRALPRGPVVLGCARARAGTPSGKFAPARAPPPTPHPLPARGPLRTESWPPRGAQTAVTAPAAARGPRCWGTHGARGRGSGSPPAVVFQGEAPGGEAPQPQDTFPNLPARPLVANAPGPSGVLGSWPFPSRHFRPIFGGLPAPGFGFPRLPCAAQGLGGAFPLSTPPPLENS